MQDAFHAALKKRLTTVIAESSDEIARGMAQSFEDYRRRVGYVQAMKDAISICEEVEKKLYGNNTSQGDR